MVMGVSLHPTIPYFASWPAASIHRPPQHSKYLLAFAAIPQPMGQGCSKRHGSLEMPALRAEGEIRDERFWPERGKNQGIGHTSAAGSYRKADSKLRGQAVPKANGVDHGDRADGMKCR